MTEIKELNNYIGLAALDKNWIEYKIKQITKKLYYNKKNPNKKDVDSLEY